MFRKNRFRTHFASAWVLLFWLAAWTPVTLAQDSSSAADADTVKQSVHELQGQIRELQSAVADMRAEAAQARSEQQQLRAELAATRAELVRNRDVVAAAPAAVNSQVASAPAESASPANEQARVARLEEQYELLSGKVDDQFQTKIESASKYRVRLSGIVLLNIFSNQGSVDNIDVPSVSIQTPPGSANGSFGGTLRQSQIGLEVFGPHIGNARTRADLTMDFGGGFPNTWSGVNTGLVRLRTAAVHLDWTHTAIVAGQDGLFFTPTTPTSFASLLTPALNYAGNLWNWVPQVHVDHRVQVSEGNSLLFQGGILDPVSGEPPPSSTYRQPQAGEASRQPAFAGRAAWTTTLFGRPFTLGAAGYFSRQDYGYSRTVNGWSAMTDWEFPLTRHLILSGKFYRGAAIGGLAAGIGRSVIFSDKPSNPATIVEPLNAMGGWAQLKIKTTPKLEFNVAFGQDNPYAADIRRYPYSQSYFDPTLTRNHAAFGNVIYRPRSDLILSAEYRQMETYNITDDKYSAGHLNLMVGVLF
jgi:hypothetical protein